MQTISKQLDEEKMRILHEQIHETELENKNKILNNKLTEEGRLLSEKEKKILEEENKIKMVEKMSQKEKEELKALVHTIEEKEKKESQQIHHL